MGFRDERTEPQSGGRRAAEIRCGQAFCRPSGAHGDTRLPPRLTPWATVCPLLRSSAPPGSRKPTQPSARGGFTQAVKAALLAFGCRLLRNSGLTAVSRFNVLRGSGHKPHCRWLRRNSSRGTWKERDDDGVGKRTTRAVGTFACWWRRRFLGSSQFMKTKTPFRLRGRGVV